MNKLLLTSGIAAVAVTGAIAVTPLRASAETALNTIVTTAQQHQRFGNGGGYGYQSSLETRAPVLGMSASELQTALQTKTLSQIAAEQGMTQEQFQAKMQAAVTARWQAMGLSSDEIAARLAAREQRQEQNQATHTWGSGDGARSHGGYGPRS